MAGSSRAATNFLFFFAVGHAGGGLVWLPWLDVVTRAARPHNFFFTAWPDLALPAAVLSCCPGSCSRIGPHGHKFFFFFLLHDRIWPRRPHPLQQDRAVWPQIFFFFFFLLRGQIWPPRSWPCLAAVGLCRTAASVALRATIVWGNKVVLGSARLRLDRLGWAARQLRRQRWC